MNVKNNRENLQMNKILILSCGTGGGHNSAALAIQEDLLDKGIPVTKTFSSLIFF